MFMASAAPASCPAKPARMAAPVNVREIRLRVAFEAQVGVISQQHLRADGSVHLMAGRASFAHRLMFEHKRPLLVFVALETNLIRIFHGSH